MPYLAPLRYIWCAVLFRAPTGEVTNGETPFRLLQFQHY